jgi:extradiol dioxygenase family protein
MTATATPFHLAFPVVDLDATREFYTEVLGCRVGREADRWIDFDFHGHQISAHLCDVMPLVASNTVDGKLVPASHFGLVLEWTRWQAEAARLRGQAVPFLIEPYIRFRDKPGEQATLFLLDPNGNGIELKAFRDPGKLFARDQ